MLSHDYRSHLKILSYPHPFPPLLTKIEKNYISCATPRRNEYRHKHLAISTNNRNKRGLSFFSATLNMSTVYQV